MGLIKKARILETRIRVNRENNKQIKKQAYQVFIQDPPRPLPNYNTLRRWRKVFAIISLVFLCIPSIQLLFFNDTLYYIPPNSYEGTKSDYHQVEQEYDLNEIWAGFLRSIPITFGILFIMFSGFTIAFDWVIYRRWGKHRWTILDW